MKFPILFTITSLTLSSIASADDTPERVSISPANDLSIIAVDDPVGKGFGSSCCGSRMSKEYAEGARIASKNHHYGTKNILIIDDGKTVYPMLDEATGLPIILLTNAKLTQRLQDLVRGYNMSMTLAVQHGRKRNTK